MFTSLRICLIIVLFIAEGLLFPNSSNAVQVSKYVNYPCNTNSYCQSIVITNCLNGMCECMPGYNENINICNNKLSKDRYDCEPNHISYNNVCYGLPGAECVKPSDCLSSSYSCILGTCQNVDHQDNDTLISKKPGISSYWIKGNDANKGSQGVYVGSESTFKLYVCQLKYYVFTVPGKLIVNNELSSCNAPVLGQAYYNTSYQLLIGSDVEWKSTGYTLDKAIYGGHNDREQLYLICRAMVHPGDAASGALEPPLYNTCMVPYNMKVTSYSNFDVLVHK